MNAHDRAFVSIVMPALNEERYIRSAIQSITPAPGEVDYELLVVDGGSTDATRPIVEAIAAGNPRIRLLINEKRSQAAAMNLAARAADARTRYLVRADCHSDYPPHFIARCIERLRTKQAASVVVPMRTEGRTCMQRAIAAAQNSRLGNGGSSHRVGGRSGFVDHGHHAAIERSAFLALGGYDESFTHNEDAEFDCRLIDTGRRIYLDADNAITYFPRTDLASLAKQYFSFGRGRFGTFAKHRVRPKLRQMLPVIVLLACAAALPLSLIDARFLVIPAAYAAICLAWGVALAAKSRDVCLMATGAAAIVMHMAWAAGFLSRAAAALPSALRGSRARAWRDEAVCRYLDEEQGSPARRGARALRRDPHPARMGADRRRQRLE